MAAISPMISIVVKPHAIGSAYGLMSSLINIGLSFGPLLIGALTKPNEKENAYANVNIFFACVSCIGVFFSIVLFVLDIYKMNSLLQKSSEYLQQASLYTNTDVIQLVATNDQNGE